MQISINIYKNVNIYLIVYYKLTHTALSLSLSLSMYPHSCTDTNTHTHTHIYTNMHADATQAYLAV